MSKLEQMLSLVRPLLEQSKLFSMIIAVLVLISGQLIAVSGVGAQTLTPAQINALQSGVYYFNTEACSSGDSSTGSSSGSSTIQGAGAWNSGTQPPYYLESFVINVLEDVATIANVPQSNTVTQEHVVALVAWAYAEGGNIANTDIFNPWNTGLTDRPDLISGTPSGNGVQSFNSFDAGVTAAAITMTGSNQNRIEQALTQSNTTGEQFMQALTYYQNYPGNQAWAGADSDDQQGYLNNLMSILQQTRSNYAQQASVEIGPGQENTNHVPASELKYTGGTSSPTGGMGSGGTNTGGANCQVSLGSSVNCQNNGTPAAGNAAIACDVLQYDTLSYSQAWHSSGSVFHSKCPSIGPQCATDCSGLVNIAIYDVFHNDINETTYGEVADTTNFKKISASQLQPGDFIQPAAEAGDHVVVVEQVQGNTINTFAANTDGVAQPDQVGSNPYTLSPGDVYLRYIGQGATYQ